MRVWTWDEIKTKIQRDLDLEDEDFITEEELLGYANEAIDQAEQEVMGIYEDYLLADSNLALVSGTSLYALPDDIYAHKIRAVLYSDGSKWYPVRRLHKLEEIQLLEGSHITNSSNDYYHYIIMNEAGVGPRLRLIPTAQETSSSNVKLFYIREANRLEEDDDTMDIPEATNFVLQYMKLRCYEKEGHPNQVKAINDLEREKEKLIETLSNMVPDEDNRLLADYSFYRDFDCDFY